MLGRMIEFFVSGFYFPGISFTELLLGICLGIAFGVIWLASYWLPLFRKPWLWAVMATSVVLSWVAVSFIQIPLQVFVGLQKDYGDYTLPYHGWTIHNTLEDGA